MNRMFLLRLPTHPVLRVLTLLALAALAVLLFFLGAVIWLTLLAVGLVATLLLRLFHGRPGVPRGTAPGRGDVIEGEYKVVDGAKKAPTERRELP